MSLELLAFGEYLNTKIFIKKGNCLKELPFTYEDTFSLPVLNKFLLYSSVSPTLDLSEGLAAMVLQLEDTNLKETIEDRGTKRPKIGELIYINTFLTHWDSVILLVLDELTDVTDDDRQDLTEYMKNGLDLAEEKGVASVVMPGHPVIFKMFPLQDATDIHFEAIEMFLESRKSTNINSIYLCIDLPLHLQSYLSTASTKFLKYSTYLFVKNNSMPIQ